MQLRTDTIGHFDNPTEENIRNAISYPGQRAHENDIVKLQINERYYLCFWIGKKEKGHRLFLKFGKKQLECDKTFSSEKAVEVMIQYLHRDMSWFKSYNWNQPISEQFMENIQIIINKENS